MLMRSRLFLFLLGLYMVLNTAAAWAQGLAPTIGGPVSSVDFGPLLAITLQGVALAILVVAVWFAYTHIKNKDARDAFVLIAEKAVGFSLNAVAGATKDKSLSVNVGSSVVATALKYINEFAPSAIAHFGFDQKQLAKMLLARLPGIDGSIDDAIINQIVAISSAAHGSTATAKDVISTATTSIPELVAALAEYLKDKKAEVPK